MWTNVLTLLTLLHLSNAADNHIFVSPHGSDDNYGNQTTSAVKTLQKAVALAEHATNTHDDVYIELLAGYHDLHRTLDISRGSIVVRAYQDHEVHVTGGRRVPVKFLKSVTDKDTLARIPRSAHGHVRVIHLHDLGISDYGYLGRQSDWRHRIAPLEVFYNGQPLRLSRWPDEGFINIADVLDGQNGTRFRYNSTIPQTWQNETKPWVRGYWYFSWANQAIKVKSLDTVSRTVTLAHRSNYGLRPGHWNDTSNLGQGGYFRFINILSALNQPGEYYMDNDKGNLYVWLPNSNGNATDSDVIYVSLINDCIQLKQNIHNVRLSGFTLEVCRGAGIKGVSARNIRVSNMEIRNTGASAVILSGDSRSCTVSGCLIYDCDGGIYMDGGNRTTLESSGNIIENNEIYRFARVEATMSRGIRASGVGHVIRYNHLYDGQYAAGNDITMENNLIHHVCMNASDCGAFFTGRDWTTRGNIIRHNIVHHVLRLVPGADVRGVMLDDQSSSTSITNNIFYDNSVHVNIGGGRFNVIRNNIMYNATRYSMQVDSRGVGHKYDHWLIPRLRVVPYNNSMWTLRYPQLKYLNLKNASLPEGNQIVKNIVFNTLHKEYVHYSNIQSEYKKPKYFNISEIGFSVGPTDHFNVDIGDYRVKCYAAEWANHVNFEQVPAPNSVGPRFNVGPSYLHRGASNTLNTVAASDVCTTLPPVTDAPVPSYLPDGSRDDTLYNVSKEGCWLSVSRCTDHLKTVGTYRDTYGEKLEHAADNETMCFQRAVVVWQYCGSHANEQVAAIYGPSGATTLTGDGCYMAMYGCPKHGGPSDGQLITTGKIVRDNWAEQHQNATHNEETCLSRAHAEWVWCGESKNHPVTSIFRPTGAVRTIGAGCWIHVQHCPKQPGTKSMFYDAWGASNRETDTIEVSCLQEAEYYWMQCGYDARYPVTAFYRPTTATTTYP